MLYPLQHLPELSKHRLNDSFSYDLTKDAEYVLVRFILW